MGTEEPFDRGEGRYALDAVSEKKEALQAAAEKRKQDVLAGNLVETGKAQNTETIEKDSNPVSQVKA